MSTEENAEFVIAILKETNLYKQGFVSILPVFELNVSQMVETYTQHMDPQILDQTMIDQLTELFGAKSEVDLFHPQGVVGCEDVSIYPKRIDQLQDFLDGSIFCFFVYL